MDDGLDEYGTMEKVIKMKRLNPSLLAASLAVGVGLNVAADDLAWKFDASARPADQTAVSSAQAADGLLADVVADVGASIALFDSRLDYTLLSAGWSFHVPRGFSVIIR